MWKGAHESTLPKIVSELCHMDSSKKRPHPCRQTLVLVLLRHAPHQPRLGLGSGKRKKDKKSVKMVMRIVE
ncbi:hypothetical protein EJ110_NYTH30663 [Nymphaea thermarum]|nr:hypothetical protein EJ110_NYTH30663 [Nymphaea thermarum]